MKNKLVLLKIDKQTNVCSFLVESIYTYSSSICFNESRRLKCIDEYLSFKLFSQSSLKTSFVSSRAFSEFTRIRFLKFTVYWSTICQTNKLSTKWEYILMRNVYSFCDKQMIVKRSQWDSWNLLKKLKWNTHGSGDAAELDVLFSCTSGSSDRSITPCPSKPTPEIIWNF